MTDGLHDYVVQTIETVAELAAGVSPMARPEKSLGIRHAEKVHAFEVIGRPFLDDSGHTCLFVAYYGAEELVVLPVYRCYEGYFVLMRGAKNVDKPSRPPKTVAVWLKCPDTEQTRPLQLG